MSAAAQPALFAGAQLPRVATTELKLEALKRELAMRRRAYPRFIAAGRMSEADADYEYWIFERIIAEGFCP